MLIPESANYNDLQRGPLENLNAYQYVKGLLKVQKVFKEPLSEDDNCPVIKEESRMQLAVNV